MSKFFEYVKNIELNSLITESLNTFSYNLPENRKQRLFDFYSFSSLSPLVNDIQSSELKVVKSFAPKKNDQGESSDNSMEETTSFRGARKLNENFVDSFWKAHDKCYVELAKEMMMDIFYCISAEFEHIDQEQSYRSEKLINKIPEDLREIYKSYISGDSGMRDVKFPEKKGESGNSYNSRYEKAIRSVAMAGKSIFDFAKLCSYVYDNFRFSGSYAGPKWSDAANGFIGIANAIPAKYRPDSIFKPLGDLEDLESSTDTEAPSKEESKKTKYNFDEKEFYQIYDNATLKQQQEITDLFSEIEKHFSPHDSTKSWKIVNKTTKEDIIPLDIKVNEIKGKYIFNLLLNHDNFEGYFENKISDAITNRFKEFLDPHKETLNKVFGKKEGMSKFLQSYTKASATDQIEIVSLRKKLQIYFLYLEQKEISNFEIYDVSKWEDIFGGNDPNPQEVNNLIANYNNFTVVNSDPNKHPTAIHSTIEDNIKKIFDKYETVLNKVFGKKEETTKTEENADTEKQEFNPNYNWLGLSLNFKKEDISNIKKLLNDLDIKKFHESYDSMGIANIELKNIFNEESSKYDNFVIEYYSFLKNVKNNINDSLNNFLKLHDKIKKLLENYITNNKNSNLSKKLSVSEDILSELTAYIVIYNTKINEIFYDLEYSLNEVIDSNLLIKIGQTTTEYNQILSPISQALSTLDKSEEEKDNPEEENDNSDEDAEEETSNEIVEQKSSGSYELTPKERLALFVAIDHTWGLSHNTGPTFNKLKEFNKLSNDGRGGWLINALDKRTKDENLFRFISKNTKNSDVSQQMVPIIKRVVYSYYGATNEEELYKYVAKTNPKKQVPVHVSDVVYRYIKGDPSGDSYNSFEYPYDIDFKSHYNYWCSLTFKVKYKPTGAVCIIAAHITDHNVTILASDKNDFSFSRDGIQSSGEYVESKNSFALKEGSTNSSVITNTYKKTINELFGKIEKYNGVRINPDYTSVLGDLEMSFDELKQKINLNSDISLARIAEYGDDLKTSTKVKFQIGDDGLEFIMPHVVMTFVNAERQEETPDVTYGSPDAEEYFAGKRKKPKPAPATSNIRFSFLSKPEISKTFQFTDDVSTNIKNVIYGYISKINETGDEGLKRLQKSAVEDFNLGTLKIEKIDYHADMFVYSFPKKYKKLFNRSDKSNPDEMKLYGDHNYNFLIKIDKQRLTNPYTILLRKNEDSIVDKAYRYDSMETIQKYFHTIVEDMISNIKDLEKQEFQKILKNVDRTNKQKQTQSAISASSEASTGVISKDRLVYEYGAYLANEYPNYSTSLRNYCIKHFEKIAFSINLKKNTYPLIQYFKKLSILFKLFYEEFDARLVNENNFEKAQLPSYADLLEFQFKPISNFLFTIELNTNDDYFIVGCTDTKNNKLLLIEKANFTDAQGMVKLAILVNKEYDKMVAEGGTTAQTPQPSVTQTNTNGNISSSDITSDYLEFLTKNYPDIKAGSEREFYLIAISSFAKQQGNLVKDFYNNFTKVIKFIYNGIQSNILNNNDLANLESKMNGFKYVMIKFNLKFPLIFKFFNDREKNPYVTIELLKNTPALNTSDFFLNDFVTFDYLNSLTFTFGKKIKDAFSSTENLNLNDSVNLKELLKSFLLKS